MFCCLFPSPLVYFQQERLYFCVKQPCPQVSLEVLFTFMDFGRRFHPRPHTLHSKYIFTLDQFMFSLRIEPITLALLAACCTVRVTEKPTLQIRLSFFHHCQSVECFHHFNHKPHCKSSLGSSTIIMDLQQHPLQLQITVCESSTVVIFAVLQIKMLHLFMQQKFKNGFSEKA